MSELVERGVPNPMFFQQEGESKNAIRGKKTLPNLKAMCFVQFNVVNDSRTKYLALLRKSVACSKLQAAALEQY